MKWNIGMTPLQQMIAKVRNAHAMAAPGDVEHVTLQGYTYSLRDNQTYREPLTGWDSTALHPWERDLVANGEPFARPSNRVRS